MCGWRRGMTAFDPTEAAQAYADLETDELVRIAHLRTRTTFRRQRQLQCANCSGRRVLENPCQLIEHVRLDCREQAPC